MNFQFLDLPAREAARNDSGAFFLGTRTTETAIPVRRRAASFPAPPAAPTTAPAQPPALIPIATLFPEPPASKRGTTPLPLHAEIAARPAVPNPPVVPKTGVDGAPRRTIELSPMDGSAVVPVRPRFEPAEVGVFRPGQVPRPRPTGK